MMASFLVSEESPQKAPRIKPVISNTTKAVKKKISLKGTKPSVTEEGTVMTLKI